MPRRSVLVLVIATLGLGCSEQRIEEGRASEPLPVVAEFVPARPVRTEEEAIAAAWRYMKASPDVYFDPPRDTVNGVVYEEIALVIDSLRGPTVEVDPTDSTGWYVLWELEDGSIPGDVRFRIDKSRGDVTKADVSL